MGDTTPTVPPIEVAGQDYLRKKKRTEEGADPFGRSGLQAGVESARRAGQRLDRRGRQAAAAGPGDPVPSPMSALTGTPPAGSPAALRREGKQSVEELAQLKALGMSRPAPTGGAKRAANEAERDAAHGTAEAGAPEAQPDNAPVTEPTNSGASGPRVHTLPGEGGTLTVHGDGPDPAFQPGGFAHAGAKKAGYRAAEDRRIEAMPEKGETTYGPESVTGGHSWTLRKPGRQEARYDASRYRRAVEARQSSEDAAIGQMDAQAAAAAAGISRSKALEGDPFAPEKASVAEAVGEQRAKAQPRMRGMEMAGQLLTTYNEAKLAIQNDPTLDDAQKAQRIDQAQREFYMAMTGVAGRDVSPRHEPSMFGVLPPDEDA